MKENPLLNLPKNRKSGIKSGIPSYCTANPLAIEACLEQGKRFDAPVLVEATSNQVNQFGGYTGMKPADYRDFVYRIADRIGLTVRNSYSEATTWVRNLSRISRKPKRWRTQRRWYASMSLPDTPRSTSTPVCA